MKRFFIMAATIAVALSSCSKNEVTSTAIDTQDAISFSTYSAVATKATAMTSTQLQSKGFIVSSDATESDYSNFSSTAVTYNEGWTYDNYATTYWPTTGTVDFVAVSASALSNNATISKITAGTGATVTYTTGATAATQEDLVIAYATEQDASTAKGDVALTFVHALSKLDVSIKANTTNTDVKFVLTSITFNSVETSGTATVSADGSIAWEVGTTSTSDMSVTCSTTSFTGADEPAYTAVTSTDANNLIVLPLDLTKMTVVGEWQDSAGDLLESITAGEVNLSSMELAYNTAYTIQLTITPKIPITFSVEKIKDWGTGSNDVDYPAAS